MVRPKTILWVDDEVEGLAAHRRFLEDQGFTVAAAAHGDDALALLRRQAYSIVLLDEQMPGRRGLELIGEIRALDPAMPVVMVTQSEDEGTLREAIGIEVDDYLVKPVQPRQILSVITRLLEATASASSDWLAISSPASASSRGVGVRRSRGASGSSWSRSLARWEARLGAANEPGLSDALRSLQRSLRKDFAEYVARSTRAGSPVPKATGRRSPSTWAPNSSCPCCDPRGECCSWSSTACGSTSGRCCATL